MTPAILWVPGSGICWDVAGGEQQLSAEEEKALEAAAYRAWQLEALNPLIQEWSSQYEIETHPELLDE